MTGRPHDALFKAAFEQPEHARPMLRSILPAALTEAITWDSMCTVPGSFIDRELADSHSDLLFSVELRGHPAYLYLLLEHQSTVDPDMPLRMLEYMARIWRRHRKRHNGEPLPLIIPAAVSHARGGWTGPVSLEDMFEPHPCSVPGLAALVPSFSILVDDLTHLSDQDIRDRALAAFQSLALWVLRDARDAETLLRELRLWTEEFRKASAAPHGLQAVAQLLRYISLVSGELQFQRFHAMIRRQLPEAEEAIMTIAEQLRAEGLKQGIQQGIQQGRREALITMLEEQLALKFGELSNGQRARIEAASEAQLTRYIRQILTADSVEAVFAEPQSGSSF